MALKLQILICTYGERLHGIDPKCMPQLDGVEYLICCQNPDNLDMWETARTLASRGDTEVHFFCDKGGSLNRNHTLDMATAPYVLVSDDDISYSAEGLKSIIDMFDEDPTLDMITTRSLISGGEPERHIYPADGHDLAVPFRFYSPIAFEIALRRSAIELHGLRFSPLSGIGAPYLCCGEENFFFINAVRNGLKGRFADIAVSTHRGNTTCTHSATKPGVIRTKGAVMFFDRGFFGGLIRLPIEACRSKSPFFPALGYLAEGFIYAIRHRREL